MYPVGGQRKWTPPFCCILFLYHFHILKGEAISRRKSPWTVSLYYHSSIGGVAPSVPRSLSYDSDVHFSLLGLHHSTFRISRGWVILLLDSTLSLLWYFMLQWMILVWFSFIFMSYFLCPFWGKLDSCLTLVNNVLGCAYLDLFKPPTHIFWIFV